MHLGNPTFSADQAGTRSVAGLTPAPPKAAAFLRHIESAGIVPADPDTVFTYLDDPRRLSSHMSKSSWMMLGSKMRIGLDKNEGRDRGSVIRLSGRVLGIEIGLEEIVTERDVPLRKTWETIGVPNLLVVGAYRMGFEIQARGADSILRVFIDFDLPAKSRWLGRLLGATYARWCVKQMIADAVGHFAHARQS